MKGDAVAFFVMAVFIVALLMTVVLADLPQAPTRRVEPDRYKQRPTRPVRPLTEVAQDEPRPRNDVIPRSEADQAIDDHARLVQQYRDMVDELYDLGDLVTERRAGRRHD